MKNHFLCNVAYFELGAKDAEMFLKKALDASFNDFVIDQDEPLWIELAKGMVSYFPLLDANVRSKLVPGRIKEHEFWRRFLWRLRKELRKSYDRERSVAIAAVVKACRSTAAVHQRLIAGQTLEKDDRSPVTVADFASQAVILSELARAFPSDRVCGEEDTGLLRGDTDQVRQLRATVTALANGSLGADAQLSDDAMLEAIDRGCFKGGAKGRFWTVDPVDGTKGFLRGEQYAVCLALIEDGEVVLGVLGCPNLQYPASDDASVSRGCVLVAVVGGGVQLLPFDAAAGAARDPVAVHVDGIKNPAEARFCESVEEGHSSHSDANDIAAVLGITAPPLRMDSQCKYAAVARGDASIYLRLPTRVGYEEKIWDHAAGALIVKEAGGQVTDIRGRPLDFSRGTTLVLNSGVVASNGVLHHRVLDAVRGVLFPVHSYYVSLEGRSPPTEATLAAAIAQALKLDKDAVRVVIADESSTSETSGEGASSDDDNEDNE